MSVGDNRWEARAAGETLLDIVARAGTNGPQVLTVDGVEAAAVVAIDELRRLQERKPTFKEFLLSIPSLEGVDLERDRTPPRDIEL